MPPLAALLTRSSIICEVIGPIDAASTAMAASACIRRRESSDGQRSRSSDRRSKCRWPLCQQASQPPACTPTGTLRLDAPTKPVAAFASAMIAAASFLDRDHFADICCISVASQMIAVAPFGLEIMVFRKEHFAHRQRKRTKATRSRIEIDDQLAAMAAIPSPYSGTTLVPASAPFAQGASTTFGMPNPILIFQLRILLMTFHSMLAAIDKPYIQVTGKRKNATVARSDCTPAPDLICRDAGPTIWPGGLQSRTPKPDLWNRPPKHDDNSQLFPSLSARYEF